MTSFEDDYRHAPRLIGNARPFQYDPDLDRAPDLFDTDPQAWLKLPVQLQDQSSIYRDFRAHYRRAVEAGVIPDDRNARTYKENRR